MDLCRSSGLAVEGVGQSLGESDGLISLGDSTLGEALGISVWEEALGVSILEEVLGVSAWGSQQPSCHIWCRQ